MNVGCCPFIVCQKGWKRDWTFSDLGFCGKRIKYHLVNWPSVCTPKDLGGLGVIDLDLMNVVC